MRYRTSPRAERTKWDVAAERPSTTGREPPTPLLAHTPRRLDLLILGCGRLTNWPESEPLSSRRPATNEERSGRREQQERAGIRSDSSWEPPHKPLTNASGPRRLSPSNPAVDPSVTRVTARVGQSGPLVKPSDRTNVIDRESQVCWPHVEAPEGGAVRLITRLGCSTAITTTMLLLAGCTSTPVESGVITGAVQRLRAAGSTRASSHSGSGDTPERRKDGCY